MTATTNVNAAMVIVTGHSQKNSTELYSSFIIDPIGSKMLISNKSFFCQKNGLILRSDSLYVFVF